MSTVNSLEMVGVAVADVRPDAVSPNSNVLNFPAAKIPSLRQLVRCRRDASVDLSAPAKTSELELARLLDYSVGRRAVTLWIKRAIDVIGAAVGMVLLSPLLAMVAVAIRLSSPGPVLFTQMRHGLGSKPFRIYKFRTFFVDQSDPTGRAQTMPNDHRITPLGRVLRRSNIDELPQLWNVLIGDMSLVGPRPHAIGMKAAGIAYEDLIPVYPLRHLVKPGITGLAQVRGFRGTTTRTERARGRILNDLLYIQRISIPLDLTIILATLLHELRHGTGV